MRLKYQLFITLLIASSLLVALMFVVSSLSFSRGFLGYINTAEQQSVQTLAQELEKQYARDANWDNTQANPRIFRTLLRNSGARHLPRRHELQNLRPGMRPSPIPASERINQRLALTDPNKQILAGQLTISNETNWVSLRHNEEIIGYLGLNNLKKLNNNIDRAFERQQRKSFALAGLAMLVLSSLLAAPLTSRIVKPILNVKKTVAQLSNGNFSDRINTTRRDEIGDLSRDINKLGETLKNNKDARQRQFAEISHELRTPVGVLQAELEAIQDGIRPLEKQAINSLHTETLRLKRLIGDLHTLSLADAEALDYQMQSLDFIECMTGVIERHKKTHHELEIDLQFQGIDPQQSICMLGDKQRLEQLFDNLFQNTARYTTLPGKLQIVLSADNNTVTAAWNDSAPGVPTDALTKLFDPLFRVEVSRNREHGGSGLGLSIVKKIVDAHNGTCSAHHSELGGLNLTLCFPRTGTV